MSLPTPLTIFVLLIIILSTLRTRLVYEISGTSLLLFGSTLPGLWFYSIFMLPGTILHELSHWIVAEILQVRTGKITILPEIKGEGSHERLGSVATERSDPFRAFLIGVAPFFTGLLSLAVLGSLLQGGWGAYVWWQLTLIVYGIVVIGNSMMISKEDRRTWPFIIILLLLIMIVLVKYYATAFTADDSSLIRILSTINKILGVTAILNLGMIGGSYAVRRIIEQVTKKRIARR